MFLERFINVTAIPNGASFINWALDSENVTGTEISVLMNAHHSLTAYFDSPRWNITIAPATNGIIEDSNHNRVDGTTITGIQSDQGLELIAVPDEGYAIDNWNVQGSFDNSGYGNTYYVYPYSNCNVTATFGEGYTLTVQESPHGHVYERQFR